MNLVRHEFRLVIILLGMLMCGRYGLAAEQTAQKMAGRLAVLQPTWKTNPLVVQRFQIEGTGGRNNPLRNQISPPFDGDELFVRFRLRYDANSIDEAALSDDRSAGDGEFFVLWLDEIEGHDASGHSAQIPNIGIHVDHRGRNRFMVRYATASQRFGPQLKGDQEYLIVGRLWKSIPGANRGFDKLDLWVDPNGDQEFHPQASSSSSKSISRVAWLGFSTGAKTEMGDKIEVWDIDTATTWQSILNLPDVVPEVPTDQPVDRDKPQTISFKEHVVPILSQHCFECHSGDDAVEGVRLDVVDEVLNQTSPRDAKSSRLIELVTNGEMPSEGAPLSAPEIETLSTWIDEGMEWDESLLPTPPLSTDHWAFQPIQRPEIPEVQRTKWVRTPVDAFIAAKHQSLGLEPSPPADTAILNRRLALDVLGLPPEHHDAREVRSVDSLLSDPAYGQRWARYWLDLARWAESNGHQHNRPRPHAWRYRDWVIDAFNDDMPFDRFVQLQLAGDLIDHQNESNLIATGFMAAARYSGNELDKEIQRNDILVDVANTTAAALLGLTMECAQCHTHKFDPITIRDYYGFQAFFADAQPENVVIERMDQDINQQIDRRWQIFDRVHSRMVHTRRKLGHPEPIYITPKTVIDKGMSGEEKREFAQLEQQLAALPQTWGYVSLGEQRIPLAPSKIRWPLPRRTGGETISTRILLRGDVQAKGPDVSPAWPGVFGGLGQAESHLSRADLANWMTSDEHPLTARVWVNRIWSWHFGRGLVETSSDFGTQGSEPSHPELLDFLASELIDSGWSTRHIHRLILNSSTYRQSNQFREGNSAIDPDNRMLWRWEPRRLDAEVIRDSILAISDQLDRSSGGLSVPESAHRRGIYLQQQRERLPHQQSLFDGASANISCAARRVSTSPLQSLWLLNSDFVQSAADQFAKRVRSVDEAFELAFGRLPTDDQRSQLETLNQQYGLPSVCLAIINSSEFVYLP